MKILVTGGAGFIGTNFVYLMVKKGHQVVVFDKLTYAGGRDNLKPLGREIKLIVGDICDRKAVRKALKNIDWVVHFAAESHVTRSENNPKIFYRTNVLGTKIVLEEAGKTGVAKIIHISTDEVYGSIKKGYFKEEDKLAGDKQASSAYAKSKALADDLAMAMAKKGAPIIIVRPTNNFGPYQFPEKALPRWITNLILGEKIPLWGKGLQVRDWLFAPTTALAIEFLLRKGKLGEVYNLAANHRPEINNRKAAKMLCQIFKKTPAQGIDHIVDPRPGHDFRYALNIAKIKKLGWQPKINIQRQFSQTARWYLKNKKWWQKRKQEAERIYRTTPIPI